MSLIQKPSYNEWSRKTAVLILIIFCICTSTSRADQSNGPLPTVVTAGVPFYPPVARVARIEGVVQLRLTTDGKRVSGVSIESGPPMLVSAADENVRTWQFKDHIPTTFTATFNYRVLPESTCDMDSGLVTLRLPTAIEVSAKGVQTCDPTEIKH
jgi:hypothetical protein